MPKRHRNEQVTLPQVNHMSGVVVFRNVATHLSHAKLAEFKAVEIAHELVDKCRRRRRFRPYAVA